MTDLIVRYQREYMEYHQLSRTRQRDSLRVLRDYEQGLDASSLVEVTGQDVQAYAGRLLADGYHVNTVRKHLNMVRPFYSWCYAAKLIDADTFLSVKQVKNPRGSTGRTQPKPYTRAELDQLWAALDERWPLLPAQGEGGPGSQALSRWLAGRGLWKNVWRHAMRLQLDVLIRLALDCGLRMHEIFNLSVDDLHYDNEYVVIRGKASGKTGVKPIRSVPVTDVARDATKTWLEFRTLLRCEHDRPWISCYADAAAKPMWLTRFETLPQDTLGEGWQWHRFRHTAATEWLRAGAELEIVSKLLGHSNLNQTLCYTEILKSDLAKKLRKVEANFSEAVANRAA